MIQRLEKNVRIARHAMAIDEHREDFMPTIWQPRENMDLKQVWFAGAHADIGGSYKPDADGAVLSDNCLAWMISQAQEAGLATEQHLTDSIKPGPLAKIHNSRRSFYRAKKNTTGPLITAAGV